MAFMANQMASKWAAQVAGRIGDALSLRQRAENATEPLPALMAKAEKAVSSIIHGEHAQGRPGTGERFWQFREYAPEDRPQDIDWRQSGKTDRIFIRQKERQTAQKALLWCAASPGMRFSSSAELPQKAEAAQVLALSLALMLTRAGEHVGLLGRKRSGRSELTLERFAHYLVAAHDDQDLPDFTLTPPQKNAFVFMIGDFISPFTDIEKTFKALSETTGAAALIQVLDPAELTLDYEGRVVFEDPRGRVSEHVQNVTSIRDAYRRRIEAHNEALRALCRRQGWYYERHVTNEAPDKTLQRLWLAMHAHDLRAGGGR